MTTHTHTQEELQAHWYQNRNISGRFYLGMKNQELLNAQGFQSKQRLTRRQADTLGLNIKDWQEATTIVFKDFVEHEDMDDNWNVVMTTTPCMRYHEVYNLEQTYDPKWELDQPQVTEDENQPTAKQLYYLTSLIKRKYYEPWLRREKIRAAYKLTKDEVSHAIQELNNS